MQHCRERIVEGGRDSSEDQCRDHCRRNELPCGHTGGTRNDEFVVTDRRLLCSKGVLNRVHEQAPIDKIQDITINQSWIGSMLTARWC